MSSKKYKIKLDNGRVLGPLDLDRIALFIRKNKINSTNIARLHPSGEWKKITLFPEISDLFMKSIGLSKESKDLNIQDKGETNSEETIIKKEEDDLDDKTPLKEEEDFSDRETVVDMPSENDDTIVDINLADNEDIETSESLIIEEDEEESSTIKRSSISSQETMIITDKDYKEKVQVLNESRPSIFG